MISLTCLKACVNIVILCSLHLIHAITASCWFFSVEHVRELVSATKGTYYGHTSPKFNMEPENGWNVDPLRN